MNRNLQNAFEQRIQLIESQDSGIYVTSAQGTDAATDTAFNALDDTSLLHAVEDATAYLYEGLDWDRVPLLQKPPYERKRSCESWVFKHGWRVWHRKLRELHWLCR